MSSESLQVSGLPDIRLAAKSLAPYSVRTPLLRFGANQQSPQIRLKLECLQSIGSFKIRPMGNILLNTDAASLANGVYTASSGNAGLGLACMAKELNIAATIYVPETAPSQRRNAMRELGARVAVLSADDWWQIILTSGYANDPGYYVDAVRNPLAMAGSGTIGLEIAEEYEGVETVYVPFGGGGLVCGIAAAIRALKPNAKIIVAESDAAAPVTAALAAGRPENVTHDKSFIFGAGAQSVLKEMWPLINELIDDTVVISVSAVANAVRALVEQNKVVAEGAGAIAVAAALADHDRNENSVCIVSGGNIDPQTMAGILRQPQI